MAKEATQDGRAKNFLSFWSTLPGVLTAAATFITAVTGSGFCPGDLIDFKVHTSNAGSVTTDGKGGFVSTITVPPDAPSSGFSTDISANSRTNRGYASAPFTMG